MIITCSKCKTQFAVASTAIGNNGRKVRCSSCGNVWFQEPLDKIADVKKAGKATPPPEEVNPIPKNSNLPAIRRQLKVSVGMYVTLFIFIALAVSIGLLAHPKLSPKFVALLGMKNMDGVVFHNFKVSKEVDGKRLKFIISGDVVNESEASLPMPSIIATVYSKGGREMGKFTFPPPQESLLPGEIVSVQPEITGVSGNAEHVVLDMGNVWELFFRAAPKIELPVITKEKPKALPEEETLPEPVANPPKPGTGENLPQDLPKEKADDAKNNHLEEVIKEEIKPEKKSADVKKEDKKPEEIKEEKKPEEKKIEEKKTEEKKDEFGPPKPEATNPVPEKFAPPPAMRERGQPQEAL